VTIGSISKLAGGVLKLMENASQVIDTFKVFETAETVG
jgi:hypothetical protein